MKQGQPYPLGPTLTEDGVNFSIFSAHAKAMHLLLFENEGAIAASRVISLDPKLNRTGHYWHMEVPDILLVQPRSSVLLTSSSALPNAGTIASAGLALQGKQSKGQTPLDEKT